MQPIEFVEKDISIIPQEYIASVVKQLSPENILKLENNVIYLVIHTHSA